MESVWIVEYSHKHGSDIFVCASEEVAENRCLAIVNEYRDEFESCDRRTDQELLEDWGEFTGYREAISYAKEEVIINPVEIPFIDRSKPEIDQVEEDIKADNRSRYNDLKHHGF